MPKHKKNPDKTCSDRFISRSMDYDEKSVAHMKLLSGGVHKKPPLKDRNHTIYVNALSLTMFGLTAEELEQRPVLPIKKGVLPFQTDTHLFSPNPLHRLSSVKLPTQFNFVEQKILDAPSISDDFYSHLVSWGDNGIVNLALDNDLYGYNTTTSTPFLYTPPDSDEIHSPYTCVASIESSQTVLAANKQGQVRLFDCVQQTMVSKMHIGMSYAISFAQTDSHNYYLGDYSGRLMLMDARRSDFTTVKIATDSDSPSPACSISSNGANHVAVGCGDNVQIWDIRQTSSALNTYSCHQSTVRALAYSPHNRSIIVSGGGIDDQEIHVWNWHTQETVSTNNIGAQICDLFWYDDRHILSTQGYSSNTLVMHELDCQKGTLDCIKSNESHRKRVLYSAQNPKQKNEFVTASPDETLKFWQINKLKEKRAVHSQPCQSKRMSTLTIR